MVKYVKLLRINQWLKNFFILAPLLFSFKIPNLEQTFNVILAIGGFCFMASAIYIINDWKDIESDRLHPKKRNRPLASGEINHITAGFICIFCIIISLTLYFIIGNTTSLILVLFYFILNIAYCFKLKQIAIVDIIIVSMGFVIRLFIGGSVVQITLSQWIILLTFLLALLLVTGKRKHDITILETTGKSMRKSLKGYNSEFLNSLIIIIVCSIIISYILYTLSGEVELRNSKYIYITSLFVIIGLFRYLQVIFVDKSGDSPTELLTKDRFLQINIALWLMSFILISIYK